MSTTQSELIGPLLRDVSRSFYLTLRVLPKEIRPQVSLAYLLARATDTIADTKAVPRAKRVYALQQLQNLSHVPELGIIAEQQTSAGEKLLLQRLEDCIVTLGQFDEADGRRIQELLKIIIGGQIFDLQRFPGETEKQIVALASDEELDRYTYMVAGCVGEFWTKMCVAHLPALHDWNADEMCALGVRFGKGLQLVNVLRDIPKDLRIGRCYLPVSQPVALLDPKNSEAIRPTYSKWLDTALVHLDAGLAIHDADPAFPVPIAVGVHLANLDRPDDHPRLRVGEPSRPGAAHQDFAWRGLRGDGEIVLGESRRQDAKQPRPRSAPPRQVSA